MAKGSRTPALKETGTFLQSLPETFIAAFDLPGIEFQT